jgi:hypothetical protein
MITMIGMGKEEYERKANVESKDLGGRESQRKEYTTHSQ